MLSVFYFCFFFLSGSVSFFFLLRVVVFGENFRWVSVLVLRFWWCFAYVFVLCFGGSLPKLFAKILLMSGLVFLRFFSLLLIFRRRRFCLWFFSRDKAQVVTGHPHTHLFSSVLVFLSRRVCFFALVGRASCFLAFSSGCHSGPCAFWGFSWNSRGSSSLAPSEAPFWDARRQGCFVFASLACFLFSPFCFVLRLHTFY